MRTLILAAFTASILPAASISFQGSVTASSGIFELGSPVGQSVSGVITYSSSGEDLDPSSSAGLYLLSIGSIELFFDGMASSPVVSPIDTIYLKVEDVAEGSDRLQVLATVAGLFSYQIDFLGTDSFLSSTDLPTAPGSINWSQFTGGFGTISLLDGSTGGFVPVAGPDGDHVTFELTSESDVPEPSTMMLCGLGFAFLVWRRR
jgi:hypothetical protein